MSSFFAILFFVAVVGMIYGFVGLKNACDEKNAISPRSQKPKDVQWYNNRINEAKQEIRRYLVIALVFTSLAVLFLVLTFNFHEYTPPSEWSQLTDEEQDQIRDNVQFGENIGLFD